MTYFRVISIENDLFLGYQRRQLLIFGLSVSRMTYFWVIRVEDDSFLGYTGGDGRTLVGATQGRDAVLYSISIASAGVGMKLSVS